jgi:PAS domain S-box-containing protein
MPEASIVKTILAKGEGMIETIGADGVQRLYAFTSFGSTVSQTDRVYVSIGIPSSAVFAQVERTLIRNLAFLLLISLLALSAAWFGGDLLVLRRLNPIVSATKRLGAGDLSARTGIVYGKGELNQLALTFDQMAESLELRESERKRSEEELKLSEHRYRNLIDTARDVIFTLSIDGTISSLNPAFEALIGWARSEWVGKSFVLLVHPSDRPLALEMFRVALQGETTPLFELHMLTKQSEYIVGEFIAVPQFEDGQVVGILGIARDITERKRAEEEVQRNYDTQTTINSILRLSLENIPLEEILKRTLTLILSIPWLVFESRGCIFLVEDTPEVLVMKAQNGLAKPIQMSCAQVPFGKCLCGRTASTGEIYFADHIDDSHEINYEGIIRHGHYCVPIMFGGRILGVLNIYVKEGHHRNEREEEFLTAIANTLAGIIIRNRGEKEIIALQEQFRQSQKIEAIGRLAGGIAHDFNNLLTVIKGYSQLSMMELKEGDPLKPNIEEVQRAADRAAGLTRQLLAFSRRQILEMKVLDLNTILRDLDKMLRRVIGEDIELVTLLADDLGTVKADAGQIEQVVMNLAVNARDAMQKGGKLTIETANVELDENYARNHVAVKSGPYVMLSVSDTGVGMTPEVRDRVFEPFFTTKEKGKGTGLGLSTVYGIMKQSGGNIWVYSEPGKGTTFKIYLPRVDEPLEEAGEKVVQKELTGRGETILVVEDEEKVRQLTVQILTKNGYTVLEASHGDEASHICEQHKGPIHLMVMDVVMPGMNGRQLAKSLEPHHPEMKVLYMSGYTDNAIVHHGILEKGLSFLQKPFTMDGLVRKVREVLDK